MNEKWREMGSRTVSKDKRAVRTGVGTLLRGPKRGTTTYG